MLDDERLLLSIPIHKGKMFILHIGEELFIESHKKDSGIYNFYAKVESRKKTANLMAMITRVSSDIKKIQRRSFYRIAYYSDINIITGEKKVDPAIQKKYKNNPDVIVDDVEYDYLVTKGRNISGGGLGAVSTVPLELGKAVSGTFQINEKTVEFDAVVTRCAENKELIYKYDIGFKFVDLDSNIRSSIISYIFKRERHSRRKE